MSATASSATANRFIKASVPKLPTLACIGYVKEVLEPKLTKSGSYINQPVVIAKTQGGRGVTHSIFYRPEMLKPGFDPSVYESVEGGRGMLNMFRKHIAASGRITSLEGLIGSTTGYEFLQEALLSLPEVTMEAVHGVLKAALLDAAEAGKEIGYILSQGTEDSGETDENGKKIYVLTDRYEVQRWFPVTPEAIKPLQLRAKRSEGDFVITFE